MKTSALWLPAFLMTGSLALGQVATLQDYYPLQVGHRWTYLVRDLKGGQAKADPKRDVTIVVEREEPFLRAKIKDGKEVQESFRGYVLKSTSGGKTTFDHVVIMEDGVYRVHAAGTVMTPPLLFLKWPPQAKWGCNSVSGNTTLKGTFTPRHDKDFKIKAGTFPITLAISFQSEATLDKRVEIDNWYAPRIGMIKQHIKAKDHEIELELDRFEPAK